MGAAAHHATDSQIDVAGCGGVAKAYNGFGAIIMMGADVLVAEGDCCLLVRYICER